ncbi:MAG: DMT family transporter [Saprospiraceae bacterium]|nr:DMT family transporter [Saprospiraceae bacterium]
MLSPIQRSHVRLHIAILLFGLSAVLGDLISLNAAPLVLWRLLIAGFIMGFFLWLTTRWSVIRGLSIQVILVLVLVGILLSVHWVAFFASIKSANASVALVCLATTSFFTALLEPIFFGNAINKNQVLWSLLVVPGMAMVVGGIADHMLGGIWWGLLSAFLLAVIGVLNKKWVWVASPLTISFVEVSAGCLFIGLWLLLTHQPDEAWLPKGSDWISLLVLAVGCTVLGQVLALSALRFLSAFTSMIALNLEPIYGIVLAHFWLSEGRELGGLFYAGLLLILAAIFIPPIFNARKSIQVGETAEDNGLHSGTHHTAG